MTGESLGDVTFGSKTSEYFQREIHLPFFRHHLKGAPDPELPEAYVFETGSNMWKKYDDWPPAEAMAKRLYLRADDALSFDAPSLLEAHDSYAM